MGEEFEGSGSVQGLKAVCSVLLPTCYGLESDGELFAVSLTSPTGV